VELVLASRQEVVVSRFLRAAHDFLSARRRFLWESLRKAEEKSAKHVSGDVTSRLEAISRRCFSPAPTSRVQVRYTNIGLFSGTIAISFQMTQCRITLLLQPITKLYLFTIELKLRDDFRCCRSKMCFRTFSTVPLNSPIGYNKILLQPTVADLTGLVQ